MIDDGQTPGQPTAPPQYIRALERANEVRLARAELKHKVSMEEIAAAEVILACPWEAHSMAIADLLMSQRRWGQTRCRKFLAQIPMSEKKTIGSLTDSERRTLAAMLTSAEWGRAWGATPWVTDSLTSGRRVQDDQATASSSATEEPDVETGPVDDRWNELVETARRYEGISEQLNRLAARRDELIRSLSEEGASRRAVAAAASLTVGRIQQIVDEGQPNTSQTPSLSPVGDS